MTQCPQPRIIAGFGRSGTTWLQDSLAEANGLRAVFEPLHPHAVPGAKLHAHRYLRATDDEPDLYRFLHRYFCGDFLSLWADYRINKEKLAFGLHDLRSPSRSMQKLRKYRLGFRYLRKYHAQRRHPKRIVKFVRANLMLSWIKRSFDARIVFVIRHPAAVVSSQLRSLASWRPLDRIEQYRADQELHEVLDPGVLNLLFENLGSVEACTLLWCIENLEAVKQARESAIAVYSYEQIISDGEAMWQAITKSLDLESVPRSELVARPSQQAWGRVSEDPETVRRYAAWKERIELETANRIQAVLDAAEVTAYHIEDALPRTSSVSVLTK